jgi:hypothetical protein
MILFDVFLETLTRVFYIALVVISMLFVVEWSNHKYGDRLVSFFERRKRFIPFWSALLALLPGCNVAAAVALLYAKRLVSAGTLIAAMMATSDEAIYVFIPAGYNFIPLYVAKFSLAVATGMLFDLFSPRVVTAFKLEIFQVDYCCSIHHHIHDLRGMAKHVLIHGAKITGLVFVILLAFNFTKDFYGFEAISKTILSTGIFQPFLAGIIGLVPGCGTSVVIATLFTQGLISFYAAFSGLSIAAGDAVLVLIANKVPTREIIIILSLIFTVVVSASYLLLFLKIPFFS